MLTISADTQLYNAAMDYVTALARLQKSIALQDLGCNVSLSPLQTLLADSRRNLEAQLDRNNVEFFDSHDVMDIAFEIINLNLTDL